MINRILFSFINILIFTSCVTNKVAQERMYWVLNPEDKDTTYIEEELIPITREYLHELPDVQLFENKEIINYSKRRDLKLLSVKAYRTEKDQNNLPTFKPEKLGNHLKIKIPVDINSSSQIIADFELQKGTIKNDSIFLKPSLILNLTEFGDKCECRSFIEFEFIFKTRFWDIDDFEYIIKLNNEEIN